MPALATQPWIGLLAGPAAWAVSTQLNYSLVEWQCRHGVAIIPIAAVALALMAAAGGWLSWLALRRSDKMRTSLSRTNHFIAALGVLMAVLFSLGIVMQGAAALILDECTR